MKHLLAAVIFWTSLLGASTIEAKQTHKKLQPSSHAPAIEANSMPGAKTVHYGEKDVIKLKTKVRFTTLIVLPSNEQILDFACGDKEFWVVNGNQNFAYVKPAKEGATTNLILITSAGRTYTFVLVEVSELASSEPDLKVFVEPKEESTISGANGTPRFVAARELDSYRDQLRLAKEETQRMVEKALARQMTALRFSYRFEADEKPFHVRAIFEDEKFTYLVAKPDEIGTLYEIRDGKPNLVNFEYKNGLYIAEKVIDRGYLAIGKARLSFVRHE